MYYENLRYKMFARRTAMIAGGKTLLLAVLAGRMYQLQVIESSRYKLLADENRINLRVLAPPRGQILDRFGKPLAINRENYRVLLVAEKADDVDATLNKLARLINLRDRDRQRIMRSVRRRRSFVAVTVRENLDWQEFARIAVNMPDLPGINIDVGQMREYPFGASAAHVLGYVSAVSEEEMTGDPLLELPGYRTGKNGIERAFDKQLRGKPGSSKVEVNAIGRVIQELEREDGLPGDDIRLTIDMGLQDFVVKRITKERSASVVVMDVHGGEVLALASEPSFDPNIFSRGLEPEEWKKLSRDPLAPLNNKAVAGRYAPGSTFKMVVALAALESRTGFSWQTITCRGYLDYAKSRFHCWKTFGHGPVNMIQALQQSCDVYFYEVARRVGIERIAAMAHRLGLGDPLGIELPGESEGLIPTKDWKRATLGVGWVHGDTMISAIGQSFVLTTPLQLVTMIARLVNGGKKVVPTMVSHVPETLDPDEIAARRSAPPEGLGFSKDNLATVMRGMHLVVNSSHGTASGSAIGRRGMAMGGKTGTSQVKRITKKERMAGITKNEQRRWRDRDHALFVGYAPSHRPRYAVAVVVEHGGGGSKVAAPIARDVLLEAQVRNPLARTPRQAAMPQRPPKKS